MKLAIVGSRDLTNEQMQRAEDIIAEYVNRHSPDLIVSGGAWGVDTLAELQARVHRIPKLVYFPQRDNWSGYRERNWQIVEACTHVLCIRSEQSKTYGSGWTADRAEERGKTVYREFV